jgi:hypothetical protein
VLLIWLSCFTSDLFRKSHFFSWSIQGSYSFKINLIPKKDTHKKFTIEK